MITLKLQRNFDKAQQLTFPTSIKYLKSSWSNNNKNNKTKPKTLQFEIQYFFNSKKKISLYTAAYSMFKLFK